MESNEQTFSEYRDELREIAGTGWDDLKSRKTASANMITTAELVNLIHMRSRRMMPLVTDIDIWENYVLYTIGSRRFMANRKLEVLGVADGKSFVSNHGLYQQGLLRGGKRDDAGNLIFTENSGFTSE